MVIQYIIDILCDSSAYPLAQQPLSFIDLIVRNRGHCGCGSQIYQWIQNELSILVIYWSYAGHML